VGGYILVLLLYFEKRRVKFSTNVDRIPKFQFRTRLNPFKLAYLSFYGLKITNKDLSVPAERHFGSNIDKLLNTKPHGALPKNDE
jgi:hypothetical protein